MYIISKKKDYYDGVAGVLGVDIKILYNRNIVELEDSKCPIIFRKYDPVKNPIPSPFRKLSEVAIKKEYRKVYEHVAPFIIGFCGKLYVGWKLYSFGEKIPNSTQRYLTTIIEYDNEKMKSILINYPAWRSEKFVDHLNYVLSYDAIDLFHGFNTPVFVYDSDYGRIYGEKNWRNRPKFIINPLLKDYQFFRVFDSFTAFQEIQMFIGGVLKNKENDIIEIEDKYKIVSRGFDKWSFRKEPKRK